MSRIDVDTRRPSFRGPLAIWRRFAHFLGLRNTETREQVVRRYVTLHPGKPCTEFRRAESERLLRAQPFIATARVRALADGPDSVRIVAETVDEVPVLAAVRVGSDNWLVALGNDNAFGTGTRILLRAEQRDHYRNGYGFGFEHRQLFGRPYTLRLDRVQYPIGDRWLGELGHPFLTDLQRIAWNVGSWQRREPARLRVDDSDDELALPLRQTVWDVGGVVRIGPPGRAFLAGGALTGEELIFAPEAVLITDTGIVAAPPDEAATAAQFRPGHSIRGNLIAGFRNIRYRTARGFDALTGEQDLANGFQTNLIVGKSIPGISEDDDAFFAARAFAGRGGGRSYGGIQVDGEARLALEDTTKWDGVLGSARAAWYHKPGPRLTSIASLEWAGGWRERFPVLLELGDNRGGVRGFAGADIAGARRAVARIEQRYVVGPIMRRGDLGFAAFADAGKVWAGDAPFGETSPVAMSVGVSVLAAVPVGGQRLYRVDVAFPIRGPGDHGVEIRFIGVDRTRHFWETPDDVVRARSAVISQRIFDWP